MADRAAVLCVLLLLMACGRNTEHVRFRSADGQWMLSVMTYILGPDGSVSVHLQSDQKPRLIYSAKGDRIPRLSEAVQNAKEHTLSLLVCDAITGPVIVQWDYAGHKLLPGERASADLRLAIRHRYTPKPEVLANYQNDPLIWACSEQSGAFSLFQVAAASGQMAMKDVESTRNADHVIPGGDRHEPEAQRGLWSEKSKPGS